MSAEVGEHVNCGCNHTLGFPGLWVTPNSAPQESRPKWDESPELLGRMKKLGSEIPADPYSMGSEAELIKGLVEGLRGPGGQCWVWKRGRQASEPPQQVHVGQQWTRGG